MRVSWKGPLFASLIVALGFQASCGRFQDEEEDDDKNDDGYVSVPSTGSGGVPQTTQGILATDPEEAKSVSSDV